MTNAVILNDKYFPLHNESSLYYPNVYKIIKSHRELDLRFLFFFNMAFFNGIILMKKE